MAGRKRKYPKKMQWKAAMRNNQHREDYYFQSSLLPKEKDRSWD